MSKCPSCGESYSYLGSHWRGSCSPPSLTDKERNIIIGCLLGDGHIGSNRLTITNSNQEYIKYLQEKLGYLSSNLGKQSTTGKDSFKLTTVTHSEIGELRNWYSSGSKKFPKTLKLTPTICKHWYCGDGSLGISGKKNRCIFTLTSQADQIEYIRSWFLDVGFNCTFCDPGRIYISTNETEDFLEWMGKPPDGMEYKWGLNHRGSS